MTSAQALAVRAAATRALAAVLCEIIIPKPVRKRPPPRRSTAPVNCRVAA